MRTYRSNYRSTFLYISMSFIAIAFVMGCSNEPVDLTGRAGDGTDTIEPPDEDADLLVNTWALTDVQLSDAVAQFKILGSTVTEDATGEGSAYNLQVTFDKDGSLTSMGSYVQSISIQQGLGTIDESREIKAEDIFGAGMWSRTETILTLSDGAESQDAEILELTENTLILRIETVQTDTINGIPVTLTGIITASFDKA